MITCAHGWLASESPVFLQEQSSGTSSDDDDSDSSGETESTDSKTDCKTALGTGGSPCSWMLFQVGEPDALELQSRLPELRTLHGVRSRPACRGPHSNITCTPVLIARSGAHLRLLEEAGGAHST